MKRNALVLIVGCGRLGRSLAAGLSGDGYDVVVIDTNKDSFDDLGQGFRGSRVEGDGADLAVLQKAEIAEAAAVFAVTQNDAINLMVTQAAKTLFRVPSVLARVNDPRRVQMFRGFGIETVCPVLMAVETCRKALRSKP